MENASRHVAACYMMVLWEPLLYAFDLSGDLPAAAQVEVHQPVFLSFSENGGPGGGPGG